jgi:hypothetical protein
MTAPKTLARTAGVFYLLVIVGGFVGYPMFSAIVEPGDAAATADNIRSSETLLRLGFLSLLLASPPLLLAAVALYGLLKHVHELAAVAMLTLNAIGTGIGCLMLLNWHAAVTIATNDEYASTLSPSGADTLTLLFADMFATGVRIDFVPNSLWLLPLGYLVIKSGYFPKVLGVALIVGCFVYLADYVLLGFTSPDDAGNLDLTFGVIGGLSELAFVAWLVVKGVRQPADRPPAPATPTTSSHIP